MNNLMIYPGDGDWFSVEPLQSPCLSEATYNYPIVPPPPVPGEAGMTRSDFSGAAI